MKLNTEWMKGVGLMLLAALGIALQGAIVKYVSSSLGTGTIFFGRAIVAFGWATLYLLPYLKKDMLLPKRSKREGKKLLLLRAVCGGVAALIFYYTLKQLTVSIATLLYLTFPVFVPLVARVWLKIKIHPLIWWGLGVSFLGIILISSPSHVQGNWLILLGLISGVLGAIGSVANRVLHRYESHYRILFFYFLVTVVIASIYLAVEWSIKGVVFHPKDLLFLLLIGSTGFGFQYCFSLALKYAPARIVTPCTYFSLVFTVIADKVFWHNAPSVYQLVGIVAIVLGVLFVIRSDPQQQKLS